MSTSRPRPGRTRRTKPILAALATLGASLACSGCAAYRAERAQFESRTITLHPTAPGTTFTAGRMASVSDR